MNVIAEIESRGDIAYALEELANDRRTIMLVFPLEVQQILAQHVGFPLIYTGRLHRSLAGYRAVNLEVYNQLIFGEEHIEKIILYEGVLPPTLHMKFSPEQAARVLLDQNEILPLMNEMVRFASDGFALSPWRHHAFQNST